ncbi:hypothetical protein NQ314_003827 [Rhamnusium bicolor]|uniref:Uncharacterized protein n=1 Tax=Rhamnusium bicolor TaxID=1586634 RepID=A0AAV8ZKU2_9CUCU|nr:hypothetical protein NQ314_003827 [Rhamnusium bicolor]
MDQSDQEVMSDEDNHYADTDYDDTDGDSVDVITTDCCDENSQKAENCSEGTSNNNKFSIDSILGLSKVGKHECKIDKDVESVKKIRLYWLTERNCGGVLYQSILELQQYGRPDPLPPDPGLLEYLPGPKMSPNHSPSDPSYVPYHLQQGSTPSSLLYANWLGSSPENKNSSHIFGLQAIRYCNENIQIS